MKAAAVLTAAAMLISGTAVSFAEGDSTGIGAQSSEKSGIKVTEKITEEAVEINEDDLKVSEEAEPVLSEDSEIDSEDEAELFEGSFDDYKDAKGHWAEATMTEF